MPKRFLSAGFQTVDDDDKFEPNSCQKRAIFGGHNEGGNRFLICELADPARTLLVLDL